MAKCSKCSASIEWAIRLKTLAKIPLVPLNPNFPDAPRYKITGRRANGDLECERDDQGDRISHFSDCPKAGEFNRRKK